VVRLTRSTYWVYHSVRVRPLTWTENVLVEIPTGLQGAAHHHPDTVRAVLNALWGEFPLLSTPVPQYGLGAVSLHGISLE
jgi:hypothetical protein